MNTLYFYSTLLHNSKQMGSFVVGTLAPALRHRPVSLQLGLLVLTCIFLFGILGHRPHRELGASLKDFCGPHQAQIHHEPGPLPPLGRSWPGSHPRSGPNSADKFGKAADGPPPSHSISHDTVNGLEIYPPPPPADEDEYLAILKSMCPHWLLHPLIYMRQVSS